MALLRTNVLFPTDFEEAYNRIHAGTKPRYSGGVSKGLYIPINEDTHRKEVQKEERSVAVKRSIAYPRSRLYPQVIARGGDIQSPEARKLIPKLLEKRADDYRKLAGKEVPSRQGVSSVSPTKTLSLEIERLLTIILDTISAGLFTTDTIEAGNDVLQLLLKDGNKLSTNQLLYLFRDVESLLDNLVEPETGGFRVGISGDTEKQYFIILSLMDTITRVMRALLSRSNLSSNQRSAFQKSVRFQASKYYKKLARITPEIRRIHLEGTENLPEIEEFRPINPINAPAVAKKSNVKRRKLRLPPSI